MAATCTLYMYIEVTSLPTLKCMGNDRIKEFAMEG